MSVADIIINTLGGDITDGDPSVVSTRNPEYWPTASDSPDFTYKSLGTLWIGAGTTQNQLTRRIELEVW